jgi:arginyl-tRNA synthetase
MNIFNHIHGQILDLLQLYPADAKAKIVVEPPKDASHGDVSTNAAMVLSKAAGKNPRELAEQFKILFKQLDCVTDISIAGPGFINFRLKTDFIQKQVTAINMSGEHYGESHLGAGQKVNLEFVSANPTGPMHIGHARGAVFGDVLGNILAKAGYDVTREYYINDAGGQIETLKKSLQLRIDGATEIPAGYYPGEYLIEVAAKVGKPADLREAAVKAIMEDYIKPDLAAAGIKFDKFVSEYHEVQGAGKVDAALKTLQDKDLIYVGVLEAPKGKVPDDYEAREQTLFKSTLFGDDVDRAIKKSDGSYTYFAGDLGYHLTKVERGFTRLVNVWGVDHGGYVKRIKAGVDALSDKKVTLDVKLCALVKVVENGEALKMSKRAGNFITLRDVLDKVGKDVLRFIMLTRKNEAELDFDLTQVVQQNKDNPVFYVQYAHARCHSVLRQATTGLDGANLALLTEPAELAIIKKLAEFPRTIEQAATHAEAHRIAFYLQELAAEFHSLWNITRFIVEDEAITKARLNMVKAISQVISNGLALMGVTAPTEMR